jgi:hypothetical protein
MKKLLITLLILMLGMSPALAADIPGLTWERSMEKTYATEFNVDYFEGGYALIEVIDSASYLVVPEGMPVPEGLDGSIRVLQQPLDRIYLQATSGMALIDRLNALVPQVIYVEEVGSIRPYSHEDTVRLCLESYAKLSEEYPFIQKLDAPVKQIMLSEYMTYTHISGVYTFFTGEANLNTNYPYFVNVYTTAHEMAHQRGIARENEANFLAYLVCIHSDDPYMQYAGYLNMYEYLASPLYSASPSLYSKTTGNLNHYARYDLQCYSEFFEKYRDNTAADVSNAVNNTYLVLQGTEGSKSYGMVVDLAVAYHLNED